MRSDQRRHGDVTETSFWQKLPIHACIKKVLRKSRLRHVSASPVLAMMQAMTTGPSGLRDLALLLGREGHRRATRVGIAPKKWLTRLTAVDATRFSVPVRQGGGRGLGDGSTAPLCSDFLT